MRWSARTLALLTGLLAALAAAGCASPVLRGRWLLAETAHFTILSSASADETRRIGEGLELFRAVFGRLARDVELEPRIPTLVYVFGSSSGFRALEPRSGVAGFMLPDLHRNFLVIDAGRFEQALATAYHEYVHFVLRNSGGVRYPTWYDEGFAEMMSTVVVEDELVYVGRTPSDRARWLVYGTPLGIRKLMTTQDLHTWEEGPRARFYAQSWALTHFLHWSHREGFPDRHAGMVRYLRLLHHGVPPEEAMRTGFGESFESIETDFLRYVAARRIPYAKVPISTLEIPEGVRFVPIGRGEALAHVGELALALGKDAQAATAFRAALHEKPDLPLAHAGLAGVLPEGDERRALHEARALGHGRDDPAVQRLLAEARLGDARLAADPSRAEALRRAAREQLRASIELDPGQVAALGLLGASYLGSEEPSDEGLEALATASERLPSHPTLGLWLSQLHLQRSEVELARARLAGIRSPSHLEVMPSFDGHALEETRRAAGLVVAASPARPVQEARLYLAHPDDDQRIAGLARLVEVRGRGGLWESMYHDVVIAIDESNSTLKPTGADVDGDGKVGRRARRFDPNPDRWSTDPDDSVIRAELAAARALIEQLDPATTRVALLSFAGMSRLLAPLGPPSAALEALDGYRVHVDMTGTSLSEAMHGALLELARRRDTSVRRQPTVLLLSDGWPSVPGALSGRRHALEAASELGAYGVPVHAFALGAYVLDDPAFYRQVADRSGGTFVPVTDPADVVSILSQVRITGLEGISIENRETGKAGRAVRVFADGSFDGYVELVPGANEIEVRAELEGGLTVTETRTVFFDPPDEPDALAVRRAEALRKQLEMKAVEADLLGEMRRKRQAGSLRLEVESPAD